MNRVDLDEQVACTRSLLRSGGDANAYADPRANRLLAALPPAEYRELLPHLELVELRAPELLFAAGAPLREVYFPTRGVVSLVDITAEGHSMASAVVGNEGFVDCAVILGGASAARRAEVQIGGHAYRAKAKALVQALRRCRSSHDVLLRYVQSLMNQMAQTAVCNRHHALELRLCRWLLLCLDRAPGTGIPMTQELIGYMLGVRRGGVTAAARRLQRMGIIRCRRGRIQVVDRGRLEAQACECYGVVRRERDHLLPPYVTSA